MAYPMIKSAQSALMVTLKSSPVNFLLIFLPLGLWAGFFEYNSTLVFSLNFLAICALASILAFSTECISDHIGETAGALLNASFGNAVELIVSIIALKENQIRIVQASMLGSILSNLLLVLGCCFVFGGYNRIQQSFSKTVAQTMSSLMALACSSLVIPAAFNATLASNSKGDEVITPENPSPEILSLSRATSVVLLVVYILYLFFQLVTHRSIFEESERELELERDTQSGISISLDSKDDTLSVTASLVILTLTTIAVSFSADYLVGSVDELVSQTGISKMFVSIILIPIVGNAAEHVTAIVVAMKDKMDLAIGVAVGSSMQIALFVTPFTVLVGWAMDVPMNLYFSFFETAVLFVSVFITNYLILDGESNWLEGAMLLSAYLIIALAFFFFPE